MVIGVTIVTQLRYDVIIYGKVFKDRRKKNGRRRRILARQILRNLPMSQMIFKSSPKNFGFQFFFSQILYKLDNGEVFKTRERDGGVIRERWLFGERTDFCIN